MDKRLTAEASTITFEAATAHPKTLKAAVKRVEVEDDEQSNSSDSEVSDEDVGVDMGNVVQSIE